MDAAFPRALYFGQMSADKTMVDAALIDVVGRCNLSCIYCHEGVKANEQPQGAVTLPEFEARYGAMLPGLRHLDLFNWSEPFLNKQIFDIIDYCHERRPGIEMAISTNGHVLTDAVCERIVAGKIHNLTISISGLDNATYGIYHVGGDVEKVFAGLERLLRAQERAGTHLPLIRLRYLRFPFNFITRGALKRFVRGRFGALARRLHSATVRDGYVTLTSDNDLVRYLQFAVADESASVAVGALRAQAALDAGRQAGRSAAEIFESVTGHRLVVKPYAPECTMLDESITVRTDGAVFPCCAVPYDDRHVMGKLGEQTAEAIWGGPRFRTFRDKFRAGTNAVCNDCRLGYPVPPMKWNRTFFARLVRIARLRWLGR